MGFKRVREDANTPRTCDHIKAKPDGNKPIDILATTPGGRKVEFEESNSQILESGSFVQDQGNFVLLSWGQVSSSFYGLALSTSLEHESTICMSIKLEDKWWRCGLPLLEKKF